jgi:GTP-binding protein HflX
LLIELNLDPADGAGVSWLHRHTEVIHKVFDDHGRIAMTVRADPERAASVKAKFAAKFAH